MDELALGDPSPDPVTPPTTGVPTEPEGGWARSPRAPLHATLTSDDADVLRRTVRAAVWPLLAARATVYVLVALLVTYWSSAIVGVVVGVVLLGGWTLPQLVVMERRSARELVPGASRTTGYDHDGRLVLAAASLHTLPRGWARGVVDRDGVVVLRPRARGSQVLVALARLLTAEDRALLLADPTPPDAVATLHREVVLDRPLRAALRRHVLGRLARPPVLLLAALYVGYILVITRDLTGPVRVAVLALGLTAAGLLALVVLLVLVQLFLPLGRTVRSHVEREHLLLDAGPLVGHRLLLADLRRGRRDGLLVHSRTRWSRQAVPAALVPDEVDEKPRTPTSG